MLVRLFIVMAALAAMNSGTLAGAATYVIAPDGSGDFATIEACVAVCGPSDTIELTDGVFSGPGNMNILIDGKTLTIASQSGSPENCRIDCQGVPGLVKRAFLIQNNAFVILADIAIENGIADNDHGGAIKIHSASMASLSGVAFRGNEASWGGAIAQTSGDAYVDASDCRFLENFAQSGGGAVYTDGGQSNWYSCRFIDNHTDINGGACFSGPSGEMSFFTCIFSRNHAAVEGGATYLDSSGDIEFNSCTLSGNACMGGSAVYIGANASLEFDWTLLVYTDGAAGMTCDSPTYFMQNTNIFGNAGGDWVHPIDSEVGFNCNVSVDPEFCSPVPDEHQNWTLQEDSPCTSVHSPCGQIGAFGSGCGTVDAAESSWGALKGAFRH